MGELWLEVRKKPMPRRPEVPAVVADWVRADDLDQPEKEPELLPEITLIVERRVPVPEEPEGKEGSVVKKVPKLHRLSDHPKVQEICLQYLS